MARNRSSAVSRPLRLVMTTISCPSIPGTVCSSGPGSLTGLLPVTESRLAQPGLGIVMRHELRLHLGGLGKPPLEYLGKALVELLPGALEQRLIGCISNQGMFEEVQRLRRQPSLVKHLDFYQFAQRLL